MASLASPYRWANNRPKCTAAGSKLAHTAICCASSHQLRNCTDESIQTIHYMILILVLACLQSLQETGYQTGTGVMIGLPFQTLENLADDLLFF
ncbi:hypothetical protein [Prolixibacter sp. SD074]|uniref:hypothetical protein n=1 Tax=Prolixibacter sp. SD074 TaxID=2652391 RepID=UPI001E461D6C|nr:hypothetical protein [Prolixibacter sp. SD074]